MKQYFLAGCVLMFGVQASAASVTNPFYVPLQNHVASVTSVDFTKAQVKNKRGLNTRSYQTFLNEELAYGVTDYAALTGEIGNVWDKTKRPTNRARQDDTNIDFAVGGKVNFYSLQALKVQGSILYGQQESRAEYGTYKYMRAGGRVGYEVADLLPYVSAVAEIPLFQRHAGHDKNIYDIKAAVYTEMGQWALDGGIRYTSDREYKLNAWSVDAEASYFLSDHCTAGVYAAYLLHGDQKWHGAAYGEKIGVKVRVAF